MKFDKKSIDKVIGILKEEVVPAEGCTEPIAIAYVAARARQVLGKIPDRMEVFVSGNMIKNVKSVVVPNSGGLVGIEVSAAMGALAGDPDKELLVISSVSPKAMEGVKEFLKKNLVDVVHEKTDIKLYAKILLFSGEESASVEVRYTHTNITKVEKNGKIILDRACKDTVFSSPLKDREILSIEFIYELAGQIDLDLIRPMFQQVVDMNTRIAKEGLEGNYGVNLGKCIKDNCSRQ